MLARLAHTLVPAAGRLTVTADAGAAFAPGSIVAANHTSLADPAVVLAALHRLGVRPTVMAAAGLWRTPVLRGLLSREGHIPVHRHDRRAAQALRLAVRALERGRVLLIYPEGGLPHRAGSAESAPGAFRSGLARLTEETGAAVIPLGQAGARRLLSGGPVRQWTGLLSSPLRRPRLHAHAGAPVTLSGDRCARTVQAHRAVTTAWSTAAARLRTG
ncbi:lysophospholipid acyltransferase family protein [Streptomyces sp. bgisy153]|uniref:lysophospholipid acyltransferase family protein n=1 Tax=Streptomyces sp. bgisy153 TaxID=3413793 RepID=UPI003D7538E8